MLSTNYFFILLSISLCLIHFSKARKTKRSQDFINCNNFTYIKKPFDIILAEEYNFQTKPDPIDKIVDKVYLNVEKIRYSLCDMKTTFEEDIFRSKLAADTFNNDRLQQLDGTVTSRKLGSVLRHTVLKVGECVSDMAKMVLIVPIKVKPEVPCIMKELMVLKKFSNEIAQVMTEALKSIVNYPRDMAFCFKTESKINNCLSTLHKKVIKNTLVDIMGVAYKSLETGEKLQKMAQKSHQCPEYGTTVSKLAMIPFVLSQCIYNKIY